MLLKIAKINIICNEARRNEDISTKKAIWVDFYILFWDNFRLLYAWKNDWGNSRNWTQFAVTYYFVHLLIFTVTGKKYVIWKNGKSIFY